MAWKWVEELMADGKTGVRDDCPVKSEGMVCAFEWEGKLFHTEKEMEEAKEAKRLKDIQDKKDAQEARMLSSLRDLVDRDPYLGFNDRCIDYGRMSITRGSIATFMERNAHLISKILEQGGVRCL